MAAKSSTNDDSTGCAQCHEDFYNEEHTPRILPCSHTFCSDCIDQIISQEGCDKKCPFCRIPFKANSSNNIMINWSTLELAQKYKKIKKELEESKRKLDTIADVLNQGWQRTPQQQGLQPVLRLDASIDCAQRKLTVADIRDMSDALRTQIQRGKLYTQLNYRGLELIGQIKKADEEGELCIHHMKEEPLPSDSHVIEYSEILKMVDPSCRLTFIDFENENVRGRVFIDLYPDTEAAKEFFLHCSGEMATSFVGTNSYIDGWSKGSVDERLRIKDNETLLELDWESEFQKGEYKRPQVAGTLYSNYKRNKVFDIYTKDNPLEYLKGAFGKVYKGMDVVERFCSFTPPGRDNECRIKDCGVVIRTTYKAISEYDWE